MPGTTFNCNEILSDIRIPKDFIPLLEELIFEVLKCRPENVNKFAIYFLQSKLEGNQWKDKYQQLCTTATKSSNSNKSLGGGDQCDKEITRLIENKQYNLPQFQEKQFDSKFITSSSIPVETSMSPTRQPSSEPSPRVESPYIPRAINSVTRQTEFSKKQITQEEKQFSTTPVSAINAPTQLKSSKCFTKTTSLSDESIPSVLKSSTQQLKTTITELTCINSLAENKPVENIINAISKSQLMESNMPANIDQCTLSDCCKILIESKKLLEESRSALCPLMELIKKCMECLEKKIECDNQQNEQYSQHQKQSVTFCENKDETLIDELTAAKEADCNMENQSVCQTTMTMNKENNLSKKSLEKITKNKDNNCMQKSMESTFINEKSTSVYTAYPYEETTVNATNIYEDQSETIYENSHSKNKINQDFKEELQKQSVSSQADRNKGPARKSTFAKSSFCPEKNDFHCNHESQIKKSENDTINHFDSIASGSLLKKSSICNMSCMRISVQNQTLKKMFNGKTPYEHFECKSRREFSGFLDNIFEISTNIITKTVCKAMREHKVKKSKKKCKQQNIATSSSIHIEKLKPFCWHNCCCSTVCHCQYICGSNRQRFNNRSYFIPYSCPPMQMNNCHQNSLQNGNCINPNKILENIPPTTNNELMEDIFGDVPNPLIKQPLSAVKGKPKRQTIEFDSDLDSQITKNENLQEQQPDNTKDGIVTEENIIKQLVKQDEKFNSIDENLEKSNNIETIKQASNPIMQIEQKSEEKFQDENVTNVNNITTSTSDYIKNTSDQLIQNVPESEENC